MDDLHWQTLCVYGHVAPKNSINTRVNIFKVTQEKHQTQKRNSITATIRIQKHNQKRKNDTQVKVKKIIF